ncbi:hypothetical protein FAIPA1_70144 [Frankia sp. AiPs1]
MVSVLNWLWVPKMPQGIDAPSPTPVPPQNCLLTGSPTLDHFPFAYLRSWLVIVIEPLYQVVQVTEPLPKTVEPPVGGQAVTLHPVAPTGVTADAGVAVPRKAAAMVPVAPMAAVRSAVRVRGKVSS